MEQRDEQTKLRKYILNETDSRERSEIEERLLAEDDYFEEILIAEESLIQDYADGKLDAADRGSFERHFLHSRENRQKVRFARALRKYVDQSGAAAPTEAAEKKRGFYDALKSFFGAPVPVAIAILLFAALAGFFIWQNLANRSEVLTALNKAYKNERPIESRISDFDYAPTRNTRGAEDKIDRTEFDLAKTLALREATRNPSAENHQALGRVYLTEKEFDKAVEQFEKALQLAPENPKINNDLGAALMEKAKQQKEKRFENLDRAIQRFETAIKLDNSLNEAYFNRALCLQLIPAAESARRAWQEYLQRDSTSPWAEEARRNLQLLETQQTKYLSADELEAEFLAAFRIDDREKAWELLSKNKEIIQRKYIPQKIAMSLVAADNVKRDELLNALRYAGNLEYKRTGDAFVSDLGKYYERVEPANALLNEAHAVTREGFQLCLKNDYTNAHPKFLEARALLTRAENVWETKIIEIYIAYCLKELNRFDESKEIAGAIAEFSKTNRYTWLESLSLYRLADSQMNLAEYNSAITNFQKSAALAEAIQDSYSSQRSLISLSSLYTTLGQKKSALDQIDKTFRTMQNSDTSLRQKWRNYFASMAVFTAVRFDELGKVIARETISLAEQIKEPGFISLSQIQAGTFYADAEDYAKAREFFGDGLAQTESLSDESARKTLQAYLSLKSANLERKAGNYEKSIEFYNRSREIKDSPYFQYETQKGTLLSYLNLDNAAELERQIPLTIALLEKNRKEILEEQRKNSFFSNEQTVYDIATEWSYKRGNYEQAFNYAEISNARSLLDQLSTESAAPLGLEEIRREIPNDVQILQYTVLEKKVLIWLISKDRFAVRDFSIESGDLTRKTEDYLKLLIGTQSGGNENSAARLRLARELYDALIDPVKDLLDGGKQICIIPHKSLFYLPFQTLVSAQNDVFLSEYVILYAPSTNVFISCTKNARRKSALPENLLGVGNPSFDKKAFQDLQDLPSAETEVNNISRFYNAPQVLLSEQATKQAVEPRLKTATVIHFAGHYLVKPEQPLDSGLLLAKSGGASNDGILTNDELIREKLSSVKLVVLSGCQTGVESYLSGEGLIGLSRTFLIMDAPVVVASQWKVDSDAAAQLMENFHRLRRQERLSTANALRRAQLDMINAPDGRFKEPYYWAAFTTFGGYAEF